MDVSNTMTMDVNENTDLGTAAYEDASPVQRDAAVKVLTPVPHDSTGIYNVVIIAKLSRYDKLKKAMNDVGVTGITCTQVMGCGVQKGSGDRYRGAEVDATLLPKIKVEVVIGNIPVEKVIEAARKALYTGKIGDGKIFVYDVEKVVKIRTGEEDKEALKDVE
jgi:Amt family ammonium transporter